MEPQIRTTTRDFFLNLGAIVALFASVISLVNLLFTIINRAYPPVNNYLGYYGNYSISWPVSILIIFFPIFILLVWLLERGYKVEPDRRNIAIKRFLTYITLFIAGLTLAIDLVTVLYKFIDGQELTTAFLLKVLAVFIVALGVFLYYITELREKLTSTRRRVWVILAVIVILGAIIWGFAVIGSPRTQRLYKYDNQKVNDLMSISNAISTYYANSNNGSVPDALENVSTSSYYVPLIDQQTLAKYEYEKINAISYNICAVFNKSTDQINGNQYPSGPYGQTWAHPAGRYCFKQTINPNDFVKPVIR